MTQESYLEQLPQAAVEVQDGKVIAMNAAARAQLPALLPGGTAPDYLALSLSGDERTGSFTRGDEVFLFTRLGIPERQVLLFRPSNGGLTAQQVDGFAYRLREQMALLLYQIESLNRRDAQAATQLSQSFHKMLRMVNNLEFLNIPTDQAQKLFHPSTMDLAGLCQDLCYQAAPLLRKAGVALKFVCPCPGLLIPGDPKLLQRMLLSLISNAAKAAKSAEVPSVTLELQSRRNRAVLTVWDSNQKQVELSALLTPDEDAIPTPDQGAGMGLTVARRIIQLHGGSILCRTGENGGLIFTASLPTGPLPSSLTVETPGPEQNGGLSPFLVELADILPQELFQEDII